MKSRIFVSVLSLAVAALSLTLGGCSDKSAESADSPQSTIESSSVDLSIPDNSQDTENSEPKIPEGKPTIYTAPEGVPIYTSEITNTLNWRGDPISPDEITADEESEIFCEGFQYFKEPIGVTFDSYHNPEMFGEYEFIGDIPQNNNTFKRLYVGDEICGLKLTKAMSHFTNFDGEIKFDNTISTPWGLKACPGNIAEFEGTVTLEGFLFITQPNIYKPEGGDLEFYPIEEKLPLLSYENGGGPTLFCPASGIFDLTDKLYVLNESGLGLTQERYSHTNIDGMGVGDLALVRATISDLSYYNGGGAHAVLEDIEVLSEVIKHVDSEI